MFLFLEIDNYGILKKKNFIIKMIWKYKNCEETTQAGFKKNSFIYDFMSSMRQKLMTLLGYRGPKNEKKLASDNC